MVQIRNSERVALIGATGMGKTELAKFLLRDTRRSIVIDPKRNFKLDRFSVRRGIPLLASEWNIILRPNYMRASTDEELATVLHEAWRRGNVIIYIDELTLITQRYPWSTAMLEAIAATGRERKVSLWTAMQRPRHVPLLFLTESEVMLCFSLRNAADRMHIAGFMGREVLTQADTHEFWYVRPGMKTAVLCRLDLGRGTIAPVRGMVEQAQVKEGALAW